MLVGKKVSFCSGESENPVYPSVWTRPPTLPEAKKNMARHFSFFRCPMLMISRGKLRYSFYLFYRKNYAILKAKILSGSDEN